MNISCAPHGIVAFKNPKQGIGDIIGAGFEYILLDLAAAPCLSRNTKRDNINEFLRKLAAESIKICGQAGCKYLIVQPLFAGISSQDLWECNRGYVC